MGILSEDSTMNAPLQITIRGVRRTESIEAKIRERAEKLERFFDRITRCHVIVEPVRGRGRHGTPFDVRINLSVPGAELVVTPEPQSDLGLAIRDAFDAARRRLEDHARRMRGEVKRHAAAVRAEEPRGTPSGALGVDDRTDAFGDAFDLDAPVEPAVLDDAPTTIDDES
jgi:ribosomal subunit interface protein